MSLCYDFSKWTTITLAAVAISLTIGLVSLAHGQEWNTTLLTQNPQNRTEGEIAVLIKVFDTLGAKKESLKAMVDYCFQHIERPNPIQDLIDNGFASEEYRNITCKETKLTYDLTQERLEQLHDKMAEYWSR